MKTFTLLTVAFFLYLTCNATDRLVQENGLSPAFSSISAAVAASSAGDRIFIKNRANNIPWLENVTINKSLDIVCFSNDSVFYCQGSWTISGGSTAMNVNIIGMYNYSGSVSSSADGPSSSVRDTVRLIGGAILNGNIQFNNNYYDLTVYNMVVNYTAANANQVAAVVYRHGSIIGDSIVCTNGAVGIWTVAEAVTTNDTSYIQGNIIWAKDPNATCTNETYGAAINWISATTNFDIRNNLIYFWDKGLVVQTCRVSGTVEKVYNNTCIWYGYNNTFGCNTSYGCHEYGSTWNLAWCGMAFWAGGSGAVIEVMNNLVAKVASGMSGSYPQYGVDGNPNSGQLNMYYNYVGTGFISGSIVGTYTVQTNNNTSTAITSSSFGTGPAVGNLNSNLDPVFPPSTSNLGWCTAGNHGGNSSNVFANLDLTANTVGAYGGSFSLINYFPMSSNATRTWLYSYPFNANVGTTISIKGLSVDR